MTGCGERFRAEDNAADVTGYGDRTVRGAGSFNCGGCGAGVVTDGGGSGVVGRGAAALLIDKHSLLTTCVAGEDFRSRIVAE